MEAETGAGGAVNEAPRISGAGQRYFRCAGYCAWGEGLFTEMLEIDLATCVYCSHSATLLLITKIIVTILLFCI